ncbi:MAG: hypothetical protein IE928_11150, partial [Gammaproteobacteria bacterium]|nr:hypothetical protein [Gammaproteobacteria bacterium]
YAQYIIEDFDPVTGTYYKSGSGQDSAANGVSNQDAYTNYQALISGGASHSQAAAAQKSASIFGLPTTAKGAGENAYNLVLAIGGTVAEANTARTNATGAFGGGGAAGQLAAYNAAIAATGQTTFTDAQGTNAYTAYTGANTWSSDSSRLVSLFTVNNTLNVPIQPTTAAEAAQAAQVAATAIGLNASQAAQAAQAAEVAFAGPLVPPATTAAQNAFNAAFGVNGVVKSIPDAVVQAYRFDNNGKLLDFNNNGDFAMIAGNNTPPSKVTAPQNWYFDVPNISGTVGVTEAMTFEADLTKFTQYAGTYNISGVTQDGYAAGDLVNVQVNKDGTIEAQYSNGRSDTV